MLNLFPREKCQYRSGKITFITDKTNTDGYTHPEAAQTYQSRHAHAHMHTDAHTHMRTHNQPRLSAAQCFGKNRQAGQPSSKKGEGTA